MDMHSTQNLETLHGTGGVLQLPPDLLREIMGFLDVRALLTARLVCKQFRHFASGHFTNLSIDCSQLQQVATTNFTQFSGLRRVALFVHEITQLHLLAGSSIAPLLTHIVLAYLCGRPPSEGTPSEALVCLVVLPKLRSLTVRADLDVLQFLPSTLQDLELGHFVPEDVSSLTRLSALTSLGLSALTSLGRSIELGPIASVLRQGSLSNLRALSLNCVFVPSSVLESFRMLTRLVLSLEDDRNKGSTFSDVAHLTGLADLKMSDSRKVTRGDLAWLSRLAKLTCLDLSRCSLAGSAIGSSALAPLTGLVHLWLSSDCESLFPHVNVEALQSLGLMWFTGDISILRRATGLTELALGCDPGFSNFRTELGPTLARLSGLCSLELKVAEYKSPKVFHLSPILRALTGLTHLRYGGNFTVGRDMQACASLPLLRSLELWDIQVTTACLPALQAMSGLSKLQLHFTGICDEDITPEVTAAFNVERLRRGWRCLELECR